MNWADVLDDRVRRDHLGLCIADHNLTLSNSDVVQRVNNLAAQISALGAAPGSVVAVQLRNRVELVIAIFAAWQVGAAVTPVNPNLTDFETEHQVRDAAAAILIGDGRGTLPFDGEYLDIEEVVAEPDLTAPVRRHTSVGDDVALLIYTSGTTGSPKGVMLTHANLTAMCESIIDAFEMTSADRCLLVLPLFHANAIVLSTLTPLLAGASTFIAPKFAVDTFFPFVEKFRPTYFSAVPTVYSMLDAISPDDQPDVSSIRFAIGGAAPMAAELIERIESRYGFPLIEGYGLSEGTCASAINPLHGVRKPGTVGLPLSGQEIRILGSNGESVRQGEIGEVTIGGPNVMAGYLGKPEETAKVLVDGRLRTGDVGYLDTDGYLVLVDRIKDMIIRGGENLYPKEIETALYHHEDVLEAAVVGRADPVYGEVPVAYVTLRSGSPLTGEVLFDVCRKTLSKFKLPVEIITRESLPKNAVGKLDKPALRAELRTPAAQL